MSPEENKAIVRRYIDGVLNGGQLDLVDNLFAPAMHEQVKRLAANLRISFPDMEERIETLIAEGDTVSAFWIFTGTHRGDFLGIPPTGRTINIAGMSIYYLQDGVIMDDHAVLDLLGAARQLGATLRLHRLPQLLKPEPKPIRNPQAHIGVIKSHTHMRSPYLPPIREDHCG